MSCLPSIPGQLSTETGDIDVVVDDCAVLTSVLEPTDDEDELCVITREEVAKLLEEEAALSNEASTAASTPGLDERPRNCDL